MLVWTGRKKGIRFDAFGCSERFDDEDDDCFRIAQQRLSLLFWLVLQSPTDSGSAKSGIDSVAAIKTDKRQNARQSSLFNVRLGWLDDSR